MEIRIFPLAVKGDARGSLVAIEGNQDIPFDVRRIYYIYDTCPGVVRGKHAHIALKQLLICIHGTCTILLDDGTERVEVPLSRPDEGLFINSLVWREMKDFSSDAVLLVLASEHYDESDYIRKYDDFLEIAEKERARRQA